MRAGGPVAALLAAVGVASASCSNSSGPSKCSPTGCQGCCLFGPQTSELGTCVGTGLQTNEMCGLHGVLCAPCNATAECSAGACVPIPGQDAGLNCVADGGLPADAGCFSPSDCPCDMTCDGTLGTCTTVCTPAQICNAGCCSNGQCTPGTTLSACGETGGPCVDCSFDPSSRACLPVAAGGRCGCTTDGDCAPGRLCNLATGHCDGVCGAIGEPCCEQQSCEVRAVCNAGVCFPCGLRLQPCCADGSCSPVVDSLLCVLQTCVPCGQPQQPCCPGNQCADAGCCIGGACGAVGKTCPTPDGGACDASGSCGSCGGLGQPCCPGGDAGVAPFCSAGGSFCEGGSCQGCGAAGQPCCPQQGVSTCSGSLGACGPGPACSTSCGISGEPCCPGASCSVPPRGGSALCTNPASGPRTCL